MKPIEQMSAAQLDKAITKADSAHMVNVDAFIAAGRGHERPSDIRLLSDPLSLAWMKTSATSTALYQERSARMAYHGKLSPIKRKECV
jgi:hypothetical protein